MQITNANKENKFFIDFVLVKFINEIKVGNIL